MEETRIIEQHIANNPTIEHLTDSRAGTIDLLYNIGVFPGFYLCKKCGNEMVRWINDDKPDGLE